MPENVVLDTEDLENTATAFQKASQDLHNVVRSLDSATSSLEGNWVGVSQQSFMKSYKLIREDMEGYKNMMTQIASEIRKFAVQVEKADKA